MAKASKKPTAKKTTKKVAKATTKKTATKRVVPKHADPKKVASKKATKKPIQKRSNGNITVANDGSVEAYLKKCPAKYLDDSRMMIQIMSEVTKEPPVMWGTAIIGFGKYHYVYESGREGDFLLVGFSPRASALSLYGLSVVRDQPELAEKLGKYKMGKGCVYIKSLDDIHIPTLKKLIRLGAQKARTMDRS